MINVILIPLLLLYLFPLPYIFYKKGNNKFLFIASVIGAVAITEVLLILVASPAIIALIYIIPSLSELGYTDNITYLINVAGIVQEYNYVVFPMLNIWLSLLIYKKYEIFN